MSAEPYRKKRVLLVITRLTIGGDTNVVLDIADYFNNHPNFEADLAVGPVPRHEVDLTYLAYERGIPTIIIPGLINSVNPYLNFKAFSDLRAHMTQGKYDIVHTHSSVAGVIGRAAAITTSIPVIVHHVHGWGIQEDMSIGMRMLYIGLERLSAKFTDRMIAVSKPTVQKGINYHICKEDKFVLIYNGIDLNNFRQKVDEQQVRIELGLDPEYKIVGMIGRLEKQKNPIDFIQCASIVLEDYPKVQFIIAGDGSLRPDCEILINKLNLQDNFFLLGFRNDIEKILPILTLTVMSSLWEGLPVVFQEAMSAGKPIVANDVDGARDIIVDGDTGYLVPPHQSQEMAERILSLLNNEDLCYEMGAEAQRHSESFSSQQMLEKIESLYRELLSNYESNPTS